MHAASLLLPAEHVYPSIRDEARAHKLERQSNLAPQAGAHSHHGVLLLKAIERLLGKDLIVEEVHEWLPVVCLVRRAVRVHDHA